MRNRPAGRQEPDGEPGASVRFERVGKVFEGKGRSVEALRNVEFAIAPGEFVSIIGQSGCGKSTLLRVVADLTDPSSGTVTVGGKTPAQARAAREFSLMFQAPALLPWRTVEENVGLPLEVAGKKDVDKARKLLEIVGLEGFEKARPSELSGGMRQRAALARALMSNPPLLLMDEPFGALDEITRTRMNQELQRVWIETKCAVLLITHSVDEAVILSDKVLVMSPAPGTVKDIIDIDLDRPRPNDIVDTPDFFRIRSQVRKALYAGAES